MNKWMELFVGLIFVIGAILVAFYSSQWWGTTWDFWYPAWNFLKGGAVWGILMIGGLFILLGISDLKG